MVSMGIFSSFFSGKKNVPALSSGEERRVAVSGTEQERLALASSPSASREILCYMAVKDESADIRLILAERLVRLLPDLGADRHGSLYKYIVEALGMLALDEVLRVRAALSSVLKDYADAPPDVATKLARDIERQVSEPILKYCLALPDSELIEILKSHPESWAVQAIAGRPLVSPAVAGAVIGRDDRPAGTILLENQGAEISLDDLRVIVEKARAYPEWRKPVAMRKTLPPEIARELIGFVDQSVRDILLNRTDFSVGDMEMIAENVKRRVKFSEGQAIPVADRVRDYLARGDLDDETLVDAIAVRDHDFVYAAFAALLKTGEEEVKKIFELKSAKSVVALCWAAGFAMRTSFRLQQEVAKIPHKELIYPRGGTDYPLSEADLLWQLDFLGIVRRKS